MGHLNIDKSRSGVSTPPEWLGVGSAIGQLVNLWSDRDDLVALLGEDAGNGSPASYNPARAEVEVNLSMSFGASTTPEMVGNLLDSKDRYEFPSTIGVLYHEAFHARFSRWDPQLASAVLSQDEFQAIMWLEETRAENHGMTAIPKSKSFLRACATDIILDGTKERLASSTDTNTCAFYVAVGHGRLLTGVLKKKDLEGIASVVEGYFGSEVMEKLLDILARFQAHRFHGDADPVLYDLAREWTKVVQEVAEEKGDLTPQQGSKIQKALAEALREMSEEVAISNQQDLDDQQRSEEWEQQTKETAERAKETQKAKKTADEVFGKGTATVRGKTRSELQETRLPTSAERGSAVKVSKELEKAKYRERDMTEISSNLPPGRLRPRTLIQAKALKERGVMAEVEPWRRKQRKQTDNPTLNVGVMVDISGSMGSAMEPMATTAWVMSEAVRRVQGRTAMVYYGNDVFPTLKPGQHLERVNVYTAPDATESFDKAFMALDGALDLTTGTGARMLVIVSDGHYTSDEVENAKARLQQCERAGVAVLWLTFDNGDYSVRRYMIASPATEFITGRLNPVKASDLIGKSAGKVLSRVGAKQ